MEILRKRLNSGQMPMAHACNPNHSGGRNQEDRDSKPAQANSENLQKYSTPKRAGEVAQAVVCLSSKCEALKSNLSATTQKKTKN
jgi:hypothetical protein